MSDDGSVPHVRASDALPATDFFRLVRRVVGFAIREPITDPLSVAVLQISGNPGCAQSRLLMRILLALARGGEFRRAEAAELDAPTSRLVVALVDLRLAGTLGQEILLNAVNSCPGAMNE